ncbi:unnamed protein product [Debaryomyces tyrocola]|nr:unnamed protein product [Debaryomyces tyrocola]
MAINTHVWLYTGVPLSKRLKRHSIPLPLSEVAQNNSPSFVIQPSFILLFHLGSRKKQFIKVLELSCSVKSRNHFSLPTCH